MISGELQTIMVGLILAGIPVFGIYLLYQLLRELKALRQSVDALRRTLTEKDSTKSVRS
jgi:hypothetical protein